MACPLSTRPVDPIARSESLQVPSSSLTKSTTSFPPVPSSPSLSHLEPAVSTIQLRGLVECPVCKSEFKTPATLGCGHSMCRTCVPAPQLVPPIGRSLAGSVWKIFDRGHTEAVKCPVGSCGWRGHDSRAERVDGPVEPDIQLANACHAIVVALNQAVVDESSSRLTAAVRKSATEELVCHVCRSLMFQPTTTTCGHSFCRECLQRTLDYHAPCPVCRRVVSAASGSIGSSGRSQGKNHQLDRIVTTLFPLESDRRRLQTDAERHDGQVPGEMPLFECATALPGCRSYLHIFEPRYRLMMRRTFSGNRRFAIVSLPKLHSTSFGETDPDGRSNKKPSTMRFGTVLEIRDRGWLVDGRSYIESVAVGRVRLMETRDHDGYRMAVCEPVPDLSAEAETKIENIELGSPDALNLSDIDGLGSTAVRDRCIQLLGEAYWWKLHHTSSVELADRVAGFGSGRLSPPILTRPTVSTTSATPAGTSSFLSSLSSLVFSPGSSGSPVSTYSAVSSEKRTKTTSGSTDDRPTTDFADLAYWFFDAANSTHDDMYRVLRSRSVRDRLKLAVIAIDLADVVRRSDPTVLTIRTVWSSILSTSTSPSVSLREWWSSGSVFAWAVGRMAASADRLPESVRLGLAILCLILAFYVGRTS